MEAGLGSRRKCLLEGDCTSDSLESFQQVFAFISWGVAVNRAFQREGI